LIARFHELKPWFRHGTWLLTQEALDAARLAYTDYDWVVLGEVDD